MEFEAYFLVVILVQSNHYFLFPFLYAACMTESSWGVSPLSLVVRVFENSVSDLWLVEEQLQYSALPLLSGYPPPSDRHHLSCDDCLEDKRKDYQKCSVLYCVPQLYTVISTYIWTVLTGIGQPAGWGFLSLGSTYCDGVFLLLEVHF